MIKCIGCLIYDTAKDMVLLQQRGKQSSYSMKLGLWGGKMEQSEDFASALSRELREELGVLPTYEKLYPLDTFLSNDSEFIYYSFLMIVDDFEVVSINSRETFDFVWMPLNLISRLNLHPGLRRTLDVKNEYLQSITNLEYHKSLCSRLT